MAQWEHFPHISDIGIRGRGNTLEEAFEQAAIALTAVICDPEIIRAVEPVPIQCNAPENELLLTELLNTLIYEMATRKMLFKRFDLHIENFDLEGTAWGEAIDRERHQPAVEAKGATYSELQVVQQEDGIWLAQCVIDV